MKCSPIAKAFLLGYDDALVWHAVDLGHFFFFFHLLNGRWRIASHLSPLIMTCIKANVSKCGISETRQAKLINCFFLKKKKTYSQNGDSVHESNSCLFITLSWHPCRQSRRCRHHCVCLKSNSLGGKKALTDKKNVLGSLKFL